MKRTSFLRHAAALATVLITPVVTQAKRMNPFRVDKGFKVDACKDRNDKSTSLFEGDTFLPKFLLPILTVTYMYSSQHA
jgi:hypothetical protein